MLRSKIMIGALVSAAVTGTAMGVGPCGSQRVEPLFKVAQQFSSFGIDMEGDRLIVSNPDGFNLSEGVADVYEWDGGQWDRAAVLFASDTVSGDNFGDSVAIVGNRAVGGAPFHNGGRGAVYVFNRDGGGVWGEVQKLAPGSLSANDNFGASVDTDGLYIAVGAPGADANGDSGSGRVYVYQFQVFVGFVLIATLDSGVNSEVFGGFGSQVRVHGDWLAVAADGETAGGQIDAGAVYLYQLSNLGAGPERLTAPTPQVSARFGSSIDLEADLLIVGEPFRDLGPALTDAGRSRIFKRFGVDVWIDVGSQEPLPAAAGQFWGTNVAVSNGRAMVQVGDQVMMYRSDGNFFFRESEIEQPESGTLQYGDSLTLSGGRYGIGAPGYDSTQPNSGAVFAYEIDWPVADACWFGTPLLTFTVNGSTTCGTPDVEPFCATVGNAPALWYTYEPPITATYLFTTHGSNYDTVLAVYQDCTVIDDIQSNVWCNDDDYNGGILQSRVIAPLQTSFDYGVQITGYNGASGNYVINLTLAGDLDNDRDVDFDDLNIMLANFGVVGQGALGDVDGDLAVNFNDLNYVLTNWNLSIAP